MRVVEPRGESHDKSNEIDHGRNIAVLTVVAYAIERQITKQGRNGLRMRLFENEILFLNDGVEEGRTMRVRNRGRAAAESGSERQCLGKTKSRRVGKVGTSWSEVLAKRKSEIIGVENDVCLSYEEI